MSRRQEITPQVLLKAYALGIFPMAEDRDDPTLYWMDPGQRGVMPLDAFHVPKRLGRTVRSDLYEVRVDTAFADVVAGCAAPARGRMTTWINERIVSLYTALFEGGHAHTVESWLDGRLVGGLYGVSLGGAFFGESMFSIERDASKVALIHLVARLNAGGFQLLDTQYNTQHLSQFGALEITRADYRRRLRKAIAKEADFYSLPLVCDGSLAMQSISQIS